MHCHLIWFLFVDHIDALWIEGGRIFEISVIPLMHAMWHADILAFGHLVSPWLRHANYSGILRRLGDCEICRHSAVCRGLHVKSHCFKVTSLEQRTRSA